MKVRVFQNDSALAQAAAAQVAQTLRAAIAKRGTARILMSAGAGQRAVLTALVQEKAVQWSEVELFQLEEFVGLGAEHPVSSRKFLFDHLIGPVRVGSYQLLDAKADAERACRDIGRLLAAAPADVALIDVGLHGEITHHVPPADFFDEKPYVIVRLESTARHELMAGGHFASLAEVPERAIAVSLRQLLKAEMIVGIAQGAALADTVKRCLEGSVSPLAPGSVLQRHADVTLYLDAPSSALLTHRPDAG